MGYKDAQHVWKAAAGIKGMQPSDRLIWISLAFYRNIKTGECFPSVETLMERTGLSRRGVQKCVRHLQELGVLKIVPGGGRTSKRREHCQIPAESETATSVESNHEERMEQVSPPRSKNLSQRE